ncbi:MAG: PAS domain S-box protein [Dehalococcoidales bacterium]|nr:PAS domain S-box protein [Dehalococcoidales bacterium]
MKGAGKAKEQRMQEPGKVQRRLTELETKESEHKPLVAELQESAGRYRLLFELSPEGAIVINDRGIITECNKAFSKLTGYPKEQIIGNHFSKTPLARARDIPKYSRLFATTKRGEQIEPLEVTWIHNDGSSRQGELFTALIKDNKRIVCIQVTIRDITERKKTEEALRESGKRLKAIFDNAMDGIVLAEGESKKFIATNKMFCQMLGYRQEEVIELGVTDIHPREDLPYVLEQFEKQSSGKISLSTNIPVKRKNGSVFYADVNASPIVLEGRMLLLGVFRDITERKQAEAKLQETITALERSNTELEQFAYITSHDLQEPLRMITSYVQLLERRYKGQLDSDADEFIGFASDGAMRLQNMINDLLLYSRVGTRGKEFHPTNLETVLEGVMANLIIAARECNAIVKHTPLPTVNADEPQMIQLFQNLIGNALKFKSREPPLIQISVEQKGKEWVISVSDNGIGIEQQHCDRIFNIFQRLHARDYPGTGIGLAICKRIVERHGGRIWLESEPDKGSTFYCSIPV